jgi:molecular chaperone HscB
MTPEPIPLRSSPTASQRAGGTSPAIECRNCGAGAPVDEHFCPQCSRILALGRHGDYFSFLGLPRRLVIDPNDLERRFRDLSRKFHPDYFYNASPTERLASLERSSYLNDAYRALKNPVSRVEHLLAIEGLPSAKSEDPSTGSGQASGKVPPSLLEEVFALNEELDEIRELRESGADPAKLRARLEKARAPIEAKREEHERQLQELSARWDGQEDAPAAEKRATLDALRERLLERNYINNLLATIEREGSGLRAQDSGLEATMSPKP